MGVKHSAAIMQSVCIFMRNLQSAASLAFFSPAPNKSIRERETAAKRVQNRDLPELRTDVLRLDALGGLEKSHHHRFEKPPQSVPSL
jgi:hypothetical protein